MIFSLVRQTGLTAADHVWCEKLAAACMVMASVVNYMKYKYFKYVRYLKYIQSILYFVFEIDYKHILYLIHCQKVSFTAVVMAIGMWGYTPVRITGVLVLCFCVLSNEINNKNVGIVLDCRMQTPKLANLDSTWTVTGGNVSVNQPWLQLYMAACKLLDVALVLPADFLPQFQL